MANLEAEFRDLRMLCLKTVEKKLVDGQLTEDEAQELSDMIINRMVPNDLDLYEDDGWSSSMKCW